MDGERPTTIVLDAEPFCFGPISTTLNVARELRRLSPVPLRLVLLGTLTSRQLAMESRELDEVIECDTSAEDALRAQRALLDTAAVYVSNTNFRSVSALGAVAAHVKIGLIDTLFWMWDVLPPELGQADALYLQDFFGVRERARELTHPHVSIVPPLVRPTSAPAPSPLQPRLKSIVVNLGGIENIYARSGYHAFDLVSEVLAAIDSVSALRDARVVICGGGQEIGRVREHFARPNLEIGCFSPERYLSELAACSHFLTLPGLTSFCESVVRRKHTFFLLPQNYSQFLQLELIRSHAASARGLSWSDFPDMPLPAAMEPELLGVEKVRACNDVFFRSADKRAQFRQAVREFLTTPASAPIAVPAFLKGDRSGAEQVAQSLLDTFVLAG